MKPNRFLDYNFMINEFFNEIKEDVPPLQKYLTRTFEEKTHATINKADNTIQDYNNSKVVSYKVVIDELFYPEREENKETKDLVLKLAKEVALVWLRELRDPKKATSDYLSSIEGKYSWKNTTEEQHKKLLGTSATNDAAESPFAVVTENLQRFGRLTQVNAAATAHAKINGDFDRKILGADSDGAFHRLPQKMKQSLIMFAVKDVPKVQETERKAIAKQREHKQKKKEALLKNKLKKAATAYAQKLTFLEMYHSSACWRTAQDVKKIFRQLTSKSAKLEAIKDQIKMRVIGLGWKDLHHAWSKDGVEYSAEYLKKYLIKTIIPKQSKRSIPIEAPAAALESRSTKIQLGTRTSDMIEIDKSSEKACNKVRAIGLRELNQIDLEKELQPFEIPEVNENIINERIEMLWEFYEQDSTVKLYWCTGSVIGFKGGNKVIIEWDDETEDTVEELTPFRYNKTNAKAWRLFVERKITKNFS